MKYLQPDGAFITHPQKIDSRFAGNSIFKSRSQKKPTVKCPFNVADRNKRFISRKAIIISKSLHGDQREVVGHVFTKVTFKSLSTLEKGRQKAPILTRLSKHSIGILQTKRRVWPMKHFTASVRKPMLWSFMTLFFKTPKFIIPRRKGQVSMSPHLSLD